MVEGDIKEPGVQAQLLDYARQEPIDLIMATPPCQGMSTAGKKDQNDERNFLITYAVKMVQDLKPKYVFWKMCLSSCALLYLIKVLKS